MPIVLANRLAGTLEKVNVAGPLCTPLDSFGEVDLPNPREGDFVAVLNSGAYGLSASPTGFLSHEPPQEVVL